MTSKDNPFLRTNLLRHRYTRTAENPLISPLSSPSHLLSNFCYQDHVTKTKYNLSDLNGLSNILNDVQTSQEKNKEDKKEIQKKLLNFNGFSNVKKFKTEMCYQGRDSGYHQNRSSQQLMGEYRILKKIRQNRNKRLITAGKQQYEIKQSYKQKRRQKNKSAQPHLGQTKTQGHQNIKKMRKQIEYLNHKYLQNYLYHNQPFNTEFLQLHKYSKMEYWNPNIINRTEQKITKIKQHQNKLTNNFTANHQSKAKQTKYLKQKKNKQTLHQNKQNEKHKIQDNFYQIKQSISKQIKAKVKMEGEFNLYKSYKKQWN